MLIAVRRAILRVAFLAAVLRTARLTVARLRAVVFLAVDLRVAAFLAEDFFASPQEIERRCAELLG